MTNAPTNPTAALLSPGMRVRLLCDFDDVPSGDLGYAVARDDNGRWTVDCDYGCTVYGVPATALAPADDVRDDPIAATRARIRHYLAEALLANPDYASVVCMGLDTETVVGFVPTREELIETAAEIATGRLSAGIGIAPGLTAMYAAAESADARRYRELDAAAGPDAEDSFVPTAAQRAEVEAGR